MDDAEGYHTRHFITQYATTAAGLLRTTVLVVTINTSPPIPPWVSTATTTCKGIATGYTACMDSRETSGQVGNEVVLLVNCPTCNVTSKYDSFSCWASGVNQEIFDISEQTSLNGREVRVSAFATRGNGSCQGRVSYFISDGTYSTTIYEQVSLGWTVN